jgi:23S rRNA pseudouridine1911/1915/1917 synthase
LSESERTRTLRADAPGRVDAFLHRVLPGSRRLVKRLIAEGAVHVNGRRARKGDLLQPGDSVSLPDLPPYPRPEPELAIPVVHEDAYLVVLDKPGGVRAHALDPRERGTAAGFLLGAYPETETVGTPLAPGLVHRLDTGTSGLLLAARTPEVYRALRATFTAHRVEKRYLAVVLGTPSEARIDLPLMHDPGDRRRMRAAAPRARAWPAVSQVRPLASLGNHALVEVDIKTGVTHQVRAHLASIGHPVLGDVLYGGPALPLPPGRHALHAARLALPHPVSGAPLVVESPLPGDLRSLLG